LPDVLCGGTNLWALLPHDAEYYHSGEKWAKHESGLVYSVTISANGGDKLFATSFGKYPGNGNTIGTSSGIRVTFFNATGVLKTLAPQETYAEFSANGGYIVAPEGTVAVNIPMYGDDDTHALYILNRDHTYENGSCTLCGEADPDYHIPGDINGDGDVNNKDLTRLFKHLSGYEVEVVEAALDVTGDGSINNKDLTRLFRYLSGYEVEIH